MATAGTAVAASQTRRSPVKYPRREIVNAIRYVLRTGCSWRMLPTNCHLGALSSLLPTWRKDRTWQRANDALLSNLRQSQGRAASPSAAVIDSQSVKTTEKGGREVTTRASG